MRVSKAMRCVSALALVFTFVTAGRASAQCRACDMFLHCINSPMGAMVCLEGPGSCAMLIPCSVGPGRLPDMVVPDDDLTTWSLFDAPGLVRGERVMVAPGAERLTLGDAARANLAGPALAGTLADATLAHGREFAIVLADAVGDGFALTRAVEGDRVRLEVRDVRGDVPGALLASESLDDHDQLRVPVRVEGRDRVLVLQAAAVRGGGAAMELARLRRGLLAAGRTLPRRQEPLLRAHAR